MKNQILHYSPSSKAEYDSTIKNLHMAIIHSKNDHLLYLYNEHGLRRALLEAKHAKGSLESIAVSLEQSIEELSKIQYDGKDSSCLINLYNQERNKVIESALASDFVSLASRRRTSICEMSR